MRKCQMYFLFDARELFIINIDIEIEIEIIQMSWLLEDT